MSGVYVFFQNLTPDQAALSDGPVIGPFMSVRIHEDRLYSYTVEGGVGGFVAVAELLLGRWQIISGEEVESKWDGYEVRPRQTAVATDN